MTLRTIVGAENIQAPASALEVLYADAALAVVNKPAGLMVHDSALARGETDFAADRLPMTLIHRLAALCFAGLAIYAACQALGIVAL